MKLDVLPKSLMFVFAVVIGRYAANASSSSSLSLSAAENEFAEKSEMILSSSSSAMMEPLFKEWMTAFEKVYDSHQEKVSRLEIWMENDELIQRHNSNTENTYTLGHNKFSDMTQAEFAEFYGLTTNVHWTSTATTARTTAVTAAKQVNVDEGKENVHFDLDAIRAKTAEERRRILSEIAPPLESLPDYINWVQLGAVTPVKNQAGCGSCWAFSTTGALEGAKFLKTGELVSLSEQQLLDCDHIDMGCLGGLMDNGFQFDKLNGGLCSEDDYPYVSEEHKTCRSCTPVPGSTVQTYIDVPAGDEMALVSAIAIQPVSVAVDAADPIFQFYRDGVINNDDCGSGGFVNHGVLAVGYGTDLETQEPYFLVKNSWGTAYGLNGGYVKIGRKSKNGHEWGVCAILSNRSSFPIVKA